MQDNKSCFIGGHEDVKLLTHTYKPVEMCFMT